METTVTTEKATKNGITIANHRHREQESGTVVELIRVIMTLSVSNAKLRFSKEKHKFYYLQHSAESYELHRIDGNEIIRSNLHFLFRT